MAVTLSCWLPEPTSWPTMRESSSSPQTLGSPTSMPKPCRKPWLRFTPTTGCAGMMLIRPILAFAASSPILAAAHWPMSRPASKLSVAKVMSTASGGSVAVSSAMTTTPCFTRTLDGGHDARVGRARSGWWWRRARRRSRYRWSDPRDRGRSTPQQALRSAPSSSALPVAPSIIQTQKGLMFSLTMRSMTTPSPLSSSSWATTAEAPNAPTVSATVAASTVSRVKRPRLKVIAMASLLYSSDAAWVAASSRCQLTTLSGTVVLCLSDVDVKACFGSNRCHIGSRDGAARADNVVRTRDVEQAAQRAVPRCATSPPWPASASRPCRASSTASRCLGGPGRPRRERRARSWTTGPT